MILIITALGLFILSFFLPAYFDEAGYFCAKFCLIDVWSEIKDPWSIYYFFFTISNLMMVVLPIFLLTKLRLKPIPVSLIVVQTVLLMHVFSFSILGIASGELTDIKIGYYIWVLSMILMLGCTLKKRKSNKSMDLTR